MEINALNWLSQILFEKLRFKQNGKMVGIQTIIIWSDLKNNWAKNWNQEKCENFRVMFLKTAA